MIDEPLVEVCTIVGIEQNQEAAIVRIVASNVSSIASPRDSPTAAGLVSWAGLVQLALEVRGA